MLYACNLLHNIFSLHRILSLTNRNAMLYIFKIFFANYYVLCNSSESIYLTLNNDYLIILNFMTDKFSLLNLYVEYAK